MLVHKQAVGKLFPSFRSTQSRVGRYLKNQLTIIVMENIAIIDNIAINEIEKNDHIFQVQLT